MLKEEKVKTSAEKLAQKQILERFKRSPGLPGEEEGPSEATQPNPTNKPELIELFLTDKMGTADENFRQKLQTLLERTPRIHSNTANHPEFWPSFFLGSTLTLPYTELMNKLGIEDIYVKVIKPIGGEPQTIKLVFNVKNNQGKQLIIKTITTVNIISASQYLNSNEVKEIAAALGLTEAGIGDYEIKGEIVQIRDGKLILNENNEMPDLKVAEGRDLKNLKELKTVFEEVVDHNPLPKANNHKFKKVERTTEHIMGNGFEGELLKLSDNNISSAKEDTNVKDANIEKEEPNIVKGVKEIFRGLAEIYRSTALNKRDTVHYLPLSDTEAAYHGYSYGALAMNFKYRYALDINIERIAGKGYSDMMILSRLDGDKNKNWDALPVVVEFKRSTEPKHTAQDAVKQIENMGYLKNLPSMRTIAKKGVIIGVNFDYDPESDNGVMVKKLDQITKPKNFASLFNDSTLSQIDLQKRLKEKINHLYFSIVESNGGGKNTNYLSRLILGELFADSSSKKYAFVYDNNEVYTNRKLYTDPIQMNRVISTFLFKMQDNKHIVLNVIEGEGFKVDKGIPFNGLSIDSDEYTQVNVKVNQEASDGFEVEGKNDKSYYQSVEIGKVTNSQDRYKGKFEKIGHLDVLNEKNQVQVEDLQKVLSPLRELIIAENDFQAVLQGLFMAQEIKGDIRVFTEPNYSSVGKADLVVLRMRKDSNGKYQEGTLIVLELKYAKSLTGARRKSSEGKDQIKKYRINLKTFTDEGKIEGQVLVFTSDGKSMSIESEIVDLIIDHSSHDLSYDPLKSPGLTKDMNFKGVVASTPKRGTEQGGSSTKRSWSSSDQSENGSPVKKHKPSKEEQELPELEIGAGCSHWRKKRSTGIPCIDSRDEEEITKEEKEKRIKELFNTDKGKNIIKYSEFYEQFYKVSRQIKKKGKAINSDMKDLMDRMKSLNLDLVDPEVKNIVEEMKNNIENKEEIKNILRRSGVAEKIGKVAEGAGLALTAFLVGKHIANGDIKGLGYDALNLWIMPKIGEKISGKMLGLGTKLDSQILKGFAPVMGHAVGNFAAFLGLAESIKERQSATDPVDIKIADLNIATNSIFIAADIPAVITETMSVVGMEAGIIGEFAGPVGAAISVAIIIISLFVEAEFEVEKLGERINLTNQEKHDFYWDFFLGKKIPDYIENDIEAKEIYKQYISRIIDRFDKDGYTKIVISLPPILITKEECAVNANSRIKRRIPFPIRVGLSRKRRNRCRVETRVVNNEFDFESRTSIIHPFYTSSIAHNSRIIHSPVGNYNIVCGPHDDNIEVQIVSKETLLNLPRGALCSSASQYNNMKLSKTIERWFLQKHMNDCYNAVSYNRNNSSEPVKTLFYISNNNAFINVTSNYTIDVIFNGKNILLNSYEIGNQGSNVQNRYYFTNQLSNCDIHKQGANFFYIAKDNFVCNLGGSSIGQNNIVVTQGNFTDSENIHSIIGIDNANHIEVSHAGYVDGKDGNDVITAKNFTTIKGYFGDSIYGKGLVLLPINFNDIGNVTYANNITNIYNKSGAFISVEKQTLVKTADGLFVTPTKVDTSGIVTSLQITKSVGSNVILDDELDNLRKIDNSNFNITKQLSSTNYHITIGSSSNHIFYPDKEHHNFYWEAPSNISHLYLFDERNANITIAKVNGILDFSQLNSTLNDMPFIENDKGEIKINKNGLNVTLLSGYKDVTVTFDGEKYYKFQNGKLERDYCSHSLKVDGRFSVNGTDLLNHNNCFTFNSDKVLFLKLNNDLLLLSNKGALSISDYYASVHENWDLSIELNYRIIGPGEFRERADNFSSFRYYQPDEQGLQIYHNQPVNKNDIGLIDLKGKSILDFNMRVINDNLLLSYKNNTLIKVENWNTYQPAREMIFAFNDTIVSNSQCVASTCNPEDVIVEFNKEKTVLYTVPKSIGIVRLSLSREVVTRFIDVDKYLAGNGADINAKDISSKTPLQWADLDKKLLTVIKESGDLNEIESLISQGANVESENNYNRRPLHHNHLSRKPLAIDLDNRPEMVEGSANQEFSWIGSDSSAMESTSGVSKPFSWVNVFANALVGTVKGASQFILSPFKPAIDEEHSQTSKTMTTQSIDTNGTLLLLDVFIRKITGQKYISAADQYISSLEALGYALNIAKGFEKVIEQAALKNSISMHQLNIDFMEVQKEVTRKIISGKFDEILGVLNSYVEKACPSREAGCPGKLSPKKFDKFIDEFNNKLDIALNQSISQILQRGNSLSSKANRIEEQQKSFNLEDKPTSRFNNVSVHNNLTQVRNVM